MRIPQSEGFGAFLEGVWGFYENYNDIEGECEEGLSNFNRGLFLAVIASGKVFSE